ncbi:DUF4998 domain-containing protein [Marinobacter sp. ATCH36]|uniref:DUF4998 domain-containing protein n=1 Tax=Marinobacter sp. ATCH36 TaxID=2945106 RepID=UPI0020223D00|nr:DUF4998 domain-containing protein [Marinobacter sp. ATCH36]MCL7943738.1 DUF4998 domain-containing protein [Marinobacter sp. ATCH36]
MISAVVLLSGCGLDITSNDNSTAAQSQGTNEPTFEVTGAAMKGVIQQGRVTVNRLVSDIHGNHTPQRDYAKPVLTDDEGSYKWQLRGKADSWALVELRADVNTRMICDVTPHCIQSDAEPVAFGHPMGLDSSFSLRGAGDLQLETVNLTPLTHLAVTLAERSPNGLSPEAISGAYETVEGWFGLTAGSLRLTPPDLTRLDESGSVSADALQMAIANAAFLALVNDNAQWDTISDVLNNLAMQASKTGRISLMGDGVNVALADLVTAAAVQASELQATVDSSIISQRLAVVEHRNVQRFKSIADVYQDSDSSLADTNKDSTVSDPTDDKTNDTNGDAELADKTEDTTTVDGNTGDTVANTETEADEPQATETSPEDTLPANTALLSWTAPLTRENGESLSMGEIAGFEVVYGTSQETLNQSVAIGDASIDELLVDELTEGNWYFAIRTLDTDGNRSRLSEVVHKQI